MKKFLSIFVALAMVLSLFAGVGARSAKAATSLPAAIAGVTVPVVGATPVITATVVAPITAAPVTWAPVAVTFAGSTVYTATITLTGPAGTFTGVPANWFTVAGATTVTNPADNGLGGLTCVVTAVFPATAPTSLPAAIAGVTVPATGATPVITATVVAPITAAPVTWAPAAVTFAAATVYTATITLTAPAGTFTGVPANYFTVAGATTVSNAAGAALDVTKVVTAVFPATAAALLPPAGTVTLATPTQVTGTTNVLLSWTYSAADATAFNIYRNQTGTAPVLGTTVPSFSVPAGTMTYTDAATVASQVYYYWVVAINAVGNGTLSIGKSIVTTPVVVVPVGTTTTSTLGLTTTGTFVGGVDGSGALGVNGVGTVVSGTNPSYIVNVTTAAAGTYDAVNMTTAYRQTGATADINGAYNWAYTGIQNIYLNTAPGIIAITPGMKIAIDASGTMGVGRVLAVNGLTLVVNVTTAAVGIIGPKVYQVSGYNAFDADWMTVGTAQPITIAAALTAGDKLVVHMLQAVPATSATAFVMVTGVPVVGDVATLTWQDTTAASHSVSWTVVAGDLIGVPANNVAMDLANLINSLELTTGNVSVLNLPTGSVIQLTQDVGGVAGNGKTITGTTTAAVVPTLTISTLGGLTQPAYVEQGKTIKLVAKDATGAVVSATWTSSAIVNATVSTTGLVTAASVASNLTGVTVITATSGTATGVFAVVVIPVQVITSLTINLVPAVPVSTTSQQFGAIASNATYSALDYTTQVVWTDALPVASIAAVNGLLTYSTDETGNVYAAAGGITATANVKIATGVVTLVPVVGPVTKVVVLTIGSDIVTVDDKATTVDAAPEIVDGRTFVPIRFIAETFGSTVTWLPETKGITIVLGDTTIGLQIGNATAVINGNIIALDAAPYIKNSRTMVPLRVITESFGGNVAWDPINHIITITYVLPVLPAA